ncbi:PD-(D/E)XK nuclease family protein [Halobaculum marinum]|uniref:PD-(D/E)XK nuclease family protein n=1 Tax=Halobaculum marinum TaxID=3031996 RepID=UPI0031B85423
MLDSNRIRGNFQSSAHDWIEAFDELRAEAASDELDAYVKNAHENLDGHDTDEWLESVMDVFYRLMAHDPFSTWREEDPNRAKRLATLTNLLEAFTNIYNGKLRTSGHYEGQISHGWLVNFYYNFVQYVANSGFDEPEDPYDKIPEGFAQVMTVHQAKGLEFPVVLAADIDKSDGPDGTHFMEDVLAPYSDLDTDESSAKVRADGDNIRRFFVQYSRAQDALVLAGARSNVEQIALGNSADGTPITPDDLEAAGRVLTDSNDFSRFDVIDREFDRGAGVRRRYSVTGDILSYRRCARQYGHFSDYGFSPAQAAQLYFGTVVHETLDRMHQQYRGQLDEVEASVPEEADIERYFEQVSNALIAHGTKPMSGEAKERALEYIKEFNEEMAEELYPRVKDTEHRLQAQHQDFVIEGTVDVLIREDGTDSEEPSDWEIWDYKASQLPDKGNIDLENYRYQMQVYAGLYEQKNGVLPSRAVLYFMGESDPEQAQVEIEFDRDQIDSAMETFSSTVGSIERSRESQEWNPPEKPPSKETCTSCDLRWDCPVVEDEYPMRAP